MEKDRAERGERKRRAGGQEWERKEEKSKADHEQKMNRKGGKEERRKGGKEERRKGKNIAVEKREVQTVGK